MGVSIKQKVLATLDLVGAEQVSFGLQAKIRPLQAGFVDFINYYFGFVFSKVFKEKEFGVQPLNKKSSAPLN